MFLYYFSFVTKSIPFFAFINDFIVFSSFAFIFGIVLSPDIDLKLPFAKHRGFYHSLWWVLTAGVISLIGFLLFSTIVLNCNKVENCFDASIIKYSIFSFYGGCFGVSLHLLGDKLSDFSRR